MHRRARARLGPFRTATAHSGPPLSVAVRPGALGFVAALALCTLLAVADARADEPAATLEDVGRELAESAERLSELEAEIAAGRTLRRELEEALADAESHVGERRARVLALERDIARFESELGELERRLAHEHADLAVRRERLAATLRDARGLSESSALRTLLGHDDPALAARLGVYADYALRAQQAAIVGQATLIERLEAAREAASKDRNWLEHIKRKASDQRDAYAAEHRSRRTRLESVDGDLEAKTRASARLETDRERLQTLLAELEALQASASGRFLSGKGAYPLPVDGTVEARFGDLKPVGRLRWAGLFVAAPEGAPVHAVAAGEIVYAEPLQGFGLLVIIEHGDGFMTLYGGNRELLLEAGTRVDGGEAIATVGTSGGQSRSGLYFEIRENAEPVDPTPWLEPAANASSASSGSAERG